MLTLVKSNLMTRELHTLNNISKNSRRIAASAFICFAASTQATSVQFQTVMGDFEIELYDEATPITTANFLEYVEAGAYTDSFFHRSVDDFIIQGGGYTFDIENSQINSIIQNNPIKNEASISNTRGTVAMAKLPGQPDSAVSQWFINLNDSNDFLDSTDGGFTVFGKVTDEGMAIVDEIAQLQIADRRSTLSALSALPLRNVTRSNKNRVALTEDNLVIIKNIMVLGASTAAPAPNSSSSSSESSSTESSSSPSSESSSSESSSQSSSSEANFDSSSSDASSESSSSAASSESSSSSSSSQAAQNNSISSAPAQSSGGGGGSISWLMLLVMIGTGAISKLYRRINNR